MSVLADLWRLLDKRQKKQAVLLQLLAVAVALSTVVGIAAVMPFFALLADPSVIHSNPMLAWLFRVLGFSSERDFSIGVGIGFVVAICVTNALSMSGAVATCRFAHAIGNHMHVSLYREYLLRGYAFHARNGSSELSSKILYDVGRVASGVLYAALVAITSLLTTSLIVAAMIVVNPLIALLGIGALGACYTLIYFRVRRQLTHQGVLESRYFEKRVQLLTESFGAIKDVTLTRSQALFVAKFAEFCRVISAAITKTVIISQMPKYVLESIVAVVLVVASLVVTKQNGFVHWFGQLTFLALATYRLLPVLQQGFAAVARMHADGAALQNVKDDLLAAQARAAPEAAAEIRVAPRSSIRLEGVSFRFAPHLSPAVRDVSIEIPTGAMVGLFGPNGSGKSTLIDLISGLLVPQQGAIFVDGRAIDERTRADWQASIAYVPQQIFLLDRSLAENIAFGESREQVDPQRLSTAIRLAQLERCVAEWPAGVDQVLGERGAILSGGQRQKVGLARALYRDASLLALDEAASALDAPAARELQEILNRLRGGRTIVVIAHHVDAVRNCDVLFEMENGRIVRSGSFENLLGESSGLRAMVESPWSCARRVPDSAHSGSNAAQ